MTEEQVRQIIREELYYFIKTDRYFFSKLIQLADGRNIVLGSSTGTKFGTEATQKIGFLGSTPIVKQNHIDDPASGATQDIEARTAIQLLIQVFENFGFIKTS